MDKITIEKSELIAQYEKMNSTGRTLMERLFGADMFTPKDITERVKTFEDALAILGTTDKLVTGYYRLISDDSIPDDIIAKMKLKIIAKVLNEGWESVFDGQQRRYFPQFYLYPDKDKVVVAYIGTTHECTHASALISPSLTYKSSELAAYSGMHFHNIWRDLLIGR